MPSDPLRGRALLTTLFDAAVAGASPGPRTAAAVAGLGLARSRPVHLLALGKAAPAMSVGALAALRELDIDVADGLVVASEEGESPHAALVRCRGDHPTPGASSFIAARLLGEKAAPVGADHTALVLLSGGATSLVGAAVDGLDDADLARLFELLHRAGLDIHQMNVVRKRFARWGAGRLAVALSPANVHALAISDVPGDDPADIASGPCVGDPSTAHDVCSVLAEARLLSDLPATLSNYLGAVLRGERSETPKPGHPALANVTMHIVGSNRLAVDSAIARARALSHDAERIATPLDGDAAQRGQEIATLLLDRAAGGRAGVIVWGGETTVRRRDEDGGRGGRCQELALASAQRLAAAGDAARGISLLAAGTDGRDGPTDAAGGFADATVWTSAARHGVDPARALERHDSYAALDAAGALFRCGPTGTNVMDVVIGVIE